MVDPTKNNTMASQSGYDDAGSSGLGSSKLGPQDLPSKRLLGTGLSSVAYETELNGKKCARKDFIGVPTRTFKREAARLVGLGAHDNVVKTLDWTENNMSCSLVLEYMDDDLLGFLQKRKQSQGSTGAGPNSGNQSDLDSLNTVKLAPFELPEALDIMLQISRGMEYLSDREIRHGNLKTKNILVTRTNGGDGKSLSVKVADFGLVRTRRKTPSFASRQARKLDMARWTAPEILQVFLLKDTGETSSESDSDEDCTDPSGVVDSDVPEWRELGADVYSFAVICSQILTGEDPYPLPNLNWKDLGVNICRHRLAPTLPAACPRVLRELLISCLGFDLFILRQRPSFSDICRTLERLQMDFPGRSIHESVSQPEDVLKRKAPMDIEQLRESMRGKNVTRGIGLREPITVEDLWGPELAREPITVQPSLVPEFGTCGFIELHLLSLDVAILITRVKCHAEWTQLREELERMLPDMLRCRNRCFGWESPLVRAHLIFRPLPPALSSWLKKLSWVVRRTLHQVGKHQQENDRSLLPSSSAELTAPTDPRRVSELRVEIKTLAEELRKVMGHLTFDLQNRRRKAVTSVLGTGTIPPNITMHLGIGEI